MTLTSAAGVAGARLGPMTNDDQDDRGPALIKADGPGRAACDRDGQAGLDPGPELPGSPAAGSGRR